MLAVTIGIPVYNAEAYLGDAIRSVFAQTFTDWELIIVDDGSTDNSVSIAKRVESDRVRVVSDGYRRGLSYRLNQIAELARAPLLARMDADDLMHPDRLAKQIAVLKASPAVDLCGSDAFAIDANSRVKGLLTIVDPRITEKNVLWSGRIVHPTVTGRTEWFRNNPYDADYPRAEDAELWARTFRHLKLAHIDKPLLFYRQGTAGSFARYMASSMTNLKIARRYGPAICGMRETCFRLTMTVLKMGCYSLCKAAGAEEWLIGRRAKPIGAELRIEAERVSSFVRGLFVQGLDNGASIEGAGRSHLRRVS